MEFSPNNNVVKICLQGMEMEDQGDLEKAGKLFLQAWNEATGDFEKFTAGFYVARHQKSVPDRLRWLETVLEYGSKINNDTVKSAFPALYQNIARCFEDLGDADNAEKYKDLADSPAHTPSDKGPFYHGTKADLRVGDLLNPGGASNYKADLVMNHIYFTALVNGAGLAAELAKGEGGGRVYIVEPTGSFENDPNVTDKKFPGNPTRSYRSRSPLRIIGEVTDWARLSPEALQKWREKLASSKGEIIN